MTDLPDLVPPPNTCDSHIHVFDPAMPLAPWALSPGPAWATASAYRLVQKRLGLTRSIVVQPNAYGTNNSCTVAAIEKLGRADTRGVAIVDPDVTDAELERLHEAGIRGARVHLLPGGFLKFEQIEPIAAKVAKFGWHVIFQMDGRFLHEHEAVLQKLPCKLIVDHIGKFLEPVTPDHEGFKAILRLLDNGKTWLKLSAPYEVSKAGPPDYADTSALAVAAAAHKPDRMLWASNWPHVGTANPPDEQAMLNIIQTWIPDAAKRQLALVDNPAELYGF